MLFLWPPVYSDVRFYVPIVSFLTGYVYYFLKLITIAVSTPFRWKQTSRLPKIVITSATIVATVVNLPYRITLVQHDCGVCPEYEAGSMLASYVPASAKVWCDSQPLGIQLISNRTCYGSIPATPNQITHHLITVDANCRRSHPLWLADPRRRSVRRLRGAQRSSDRCRCRRHRVDQEWIRRGGQNDR